MTEHLTDIELRQFLLGDIDEGKRERIEKLFISDSESKQRILIAEEDLIEDYLDGSLSPTQKEQFLAQYGYTPQHLRRLQITRLIKQHAMTAARAKVVDVPAPQRSSFVFRLWPPNMRIMIPALAVLMIAVIVGVIWLSRFNRGKFEEVNQRASIERELAEINSTTNPPAPPSQVFSLVLPPVSVRGVGPNNEVTRNPATSVIELHLLWPQKQEFSNYRITLNRVADTEQLTINGLHVQDEKSGRAVIVKIPTHLLRRGSYQVSLSGVGDDGTIGPSEEYTFANPSKSY